MSSSFRSSLSSFLLLLSRVNYIMAPILILVLSSSLYPTLSVSPVIISLVLWASLLEQSRFWCHGLLYISEGRSSVGIVSRISSTRGLFSFIDVVTLWFFRWSGVFSSTSQTYPLFAVTEVFYPYWIDVFGSYSNLLIITCWWVLAF